jgi:hypothetical protein
MNATLATATATATTIDRIGPHSTAIRQRPQQTRNQPATTSTDIRKSRHHDISTYFSATTAVVTTTNVRQAAAEEPTTSTANTGLGRTFLTGEDAARLTIKICYNIRTTVVYTLHVIHLSFLACSHDRLNGRHLSSDASWPNLLFPK